MMASAASSASKPTSCLARQPILTKDEKVLGMTCLSAELRRRSLLIGLRNARQRLGPGLQAAAMRHAVVTHEKTIGIVKAYFQLSPVMAKKQMASDH